MEEAYDPAELSSIFSVLFTSNSNFITKNMHCGGNVVAYVLQTGSLHEENTTCYPVRSSDYPNWRCLGDRSISSHQDCVQYNLVTRDDVCYCTCRNAQRFTDMAALVPEYNEHNIKSVWTYFVDSKDRKKSPLHDNEYNYSRCNICWDNHKGLKK